jgi:hypothetical protein
MRRLLFLALAVLSLFPALASAQAVMAPTTVNFAHDDGGFAVTGSYREEYFMCSSVTVSNGVTTCVGRAAQPFTTVSQVPKSIVTGTANARSFKFADIPAGSPLPAMPVGVPFVTTLVAIGDPVQGGAGESARSTDSNPFYGRGKVPAAVTNVVVQ